MFSMIQNITSALNPLETKSIDSSLKKRRRNFDDIDDDDHPSALDTQEEDGSLISVQALILFLEDFLETRLGSTPNNKETPPPSFAPWLKTDQSNDHRAVKPEKAAKAYAHASEAMRLPVKPISRSNNTSVQEELNRVYLLIKDLRRLRDSGVNHLNVINKKTFIDGIFAAVDLTK